MNYPVIFGLILFLLLNTSLKAQEVISRSLVEISSQGEENIYMKGGKKLSGSFKVINADDSYFFISLKNGIPNGTYQQFTAKNIPVEEGTFKNGKKEGEWISYGWDGTKEETRSFKNGIPEGTWNFYDRRLKNAPVKEEIYKNGLPVQVREYFLNGKLKKLSCFEENLKSGVWKTFYNSGEPESITRYAHHQMNGLYESYYRSGKLRKKGEYLNDKPVGNWNSFYESGSISTTVNYDKTSQLYHFEAFYENGKPKQKGIANDEYLSEYHQTFREYYSNGNPKAVTEYDKGRKNGSEKTFHENGSPKTNAFYRNGVKDGLFEEFYDNGKLKELATYKEGALIGEHKKYYKNGNLKLEEKYSKTERSRIKKFVHHGEYKSFDVEGRMEEEGTYTNGKKEGCWKTFENGKIHSVKNYVNNELHGLYEFYNDGRIRERLFYNAGAKDGIFRLFYYSDPQDEGKIMQEGMYKNGKAVGTWKYYDRDGKITMTDEYGED